MKELGKYFDHILQGPFCDEPIKTSSDRYDLAIQLVISHYSALKKSPLAIYQVGEVGAPGISDLDFILVFDDHQTIEYKDLQTDSFPQWAKQLITHPPYCCTKSTWKDLKAWFPVFNLKHLWGGRLVEPKLSDEDRIGCSFGMLIDYLMVKAPRDLLKVTWTKPIRLRILLSLLHSFRYTFLLAQEATVRIPGDIELINSEIDRLRLSWFNFDENKRLGMLQSLCVQMYEKLTELIRNADEKILQSIKVTESLTKEAGKEFKLSKFVSPWNSKEIIVSLYQEYKKHNSFKWVSPQSFLYVLNLYAHKSAQFKEYLKAQNCIVSLEWKDKVLEKGLGLHIQAMMEYAKKLASLGVPAQRYIALGYVPQVSRLEKRKPNLSEAKRILVVRLDEIGDVVLTTPFLRELRKNVPSAWITLVVKPQVYNLVETCPYVDEVLTYDSKVSKLKRYLQVLKLKVFHFWIKKFDIAILPRWDVDYYYGSFLIYSSKAKRRIGYSESVNERKKGRNKNYDKLFSEVINDPSLKHEVERNLECIRFLNGKVEDDNLELWFTEEDELKTDDLLSKERKAQSKRIVALGIGARRFRKRWPIERFIELSDWIVKEYDAQVLLLGGGEDKDLGEKMKKALGDKVIDLIGKTTLRQSASLLKHCDIYIGNDTGLKHIAAATGIPVVEISCCAKAGYSRSQYSPYRFGPWKVKHKAIGPKDAFSPCDDECRSQKEHCILGVDVERVKKAAEELIKEVD